ncbi:MAG: hypothetical protein DRO14_04470 [Thermoprotei archaeon]|nr:MAG: hypothetical protein DRO14_04470 [Thermoprotei archaeon]
MEEAIYDTSVVIEAVAKNRQKIQGYVSILTVVEYPPALSYASKVLYPEKRDYHLAIRWQALLRRRGNPIPAVDLIIAAQAYNRDLTLITHDKHFEILKKEVAPDIKLIIEGKEQ